MREKREIYKERESGWYTRTRLEERKSAKTGDARRMHFARQKRTISRQGRTDHVSDTERTYRKGKRKMSRSAGGGSGGIGNGGTNARKREPRKIREHAFTCVENLERYRGEEGVAA